MPMPCFWGKAIAYLYVRTVVSRERIVDGILGCPVPLVNKHVGKRSCQPLIYKGIDGGERPLG